MTETEAAYIAGFIDGEGCLTINKINRFRGSHKTPQYSVVIMITNTNRAALEWIRDATGLRGHLAVINKPSPKWKTGYQLHYSVTDSLSLLRAIGPYLRVKKPQVDILYSLANLRQANPKRRVPGQNGTLPSSPEYIEKQEGFYRDIRRMNRRGA